jgi:hypothetical protein
MAASATLPCASPDNMPVILTMIPEQSNQRPLHDSKSIKAPKTTGP